MLIVELAVPVIDDGLNPIVTPLGCPLALSVTAESNPPVTVLVMVVFPALPCWIDTDDGEADKLNPGCAGPLSAAISPEFGLPHPVTRS